MVVALASRVEAMGLDETLGVTALGKGQ